MNRSSLEMRNIARLGKTTRKDAWWLAPLATALGLGGFAVYSFWAALQGSHYEFGHYISPFYSPLFIVQGWPLSPAFLILWAPLGFRATCYYYRKAYYRSFFLTPPACAVTPRRQNYQGEAALLLVQNLHRYFLYLGLILIVILGYDAVIAFNFDGHWGMGLGTLILLINVILLAGYTLGCHSFRHLVGGKLNCFTCSAAARARHKSWQAVSLLNARHMLWAWTSLFWVGFTDLYIRLLSMGIWHDVRFF